MRTLERRRIKGVIFDLDSTLLRSKRGALRALRAASELIHEHLAKEGYHYSRAELLRQLRLIDQFMLGKKRFYNRDVWWKALLKEMGLSQLSGPWVHQITLHYWRTYAAQSPPFQDAEPTLMRLKKAGFRIGMVSDSDGTPGMKRKRIRMQGFRTFLETIVVAGEDTPKVKPSKAPFLLVARRLGLSPKNCVYIGDNPRTDIDGAKAAGMVMIRIRRDRIRVGRPDYEVRALREVPPLVFKLSR